MSERFRQNKNAGDGIGLERSTDGGETWERVGYINTGANGSTARLARNTVYSLNYLAGLMERQCPATLGLDRCGDCNEEDEEDEEDECARCWEEALNNA